MTGAGAARARATRARIRKIVIVGNGPAAHRLVDRLHHHGYQGEVTVLGAEPRPAYHRALLTSVLAGSLPPDGIALPELPGNPRILLGAAATGIDRPRRRVYVNGESYRYDHLVLATGARPTLPDLLGVRTAAGTLSEGVTALRTLTDCERIGGGHVVVLGGGVLGTEAALALRRGGRDVTLVHPHPYPMDRQLDATAGGLLARHLEQSGITVRSGRTAVRYLSGDAAVPGPARLILDDGQVLTLDSLVLCTGVTSNLELASGAELPVRTGVLVNDLLRTDDPRISAIGDCAEHQGEVTGDVTSAWQQADVVAKLLTGGDARYPGSRRITRLKAPGIDVAALGTLGGDAELVTLRDAATGRYATLALRDQQITGAVLVGFPAAIAALSQLYDRGLPIPADRLTLLLGTPPRRHDDLLGAPDDAVICLCNNVTKKALTSAWHDGIREAAELVKATRVTTGCGRCTVEVQRLCASLQADEPLVPTAQAR